MNVPLAARPSIEYPSPTPDYGEFNQRVASAAYWRPTPDRDGLVIAQYDSYGEPFVSSMDDEPLHQSVAYAKPQAEETQAGPLAPFEWCRH